MRSRSEIKQSKYNKNNYFFSYRNKLTIPVIKRANNTLGKQRTVISVKPLLRENGEKLILPSFADFYLSVNIST